MSEQRRQRLETLTFANWRGGPEEKFFVNKSDGFGVGTEGGF
jgi:hypothetical protein